MQDLDSAAMMEQIERALKPYRQDFSRHSRLPETGVPRPQVLEELERLRAAEQRRWSGGQVSGAVYHGDPEHIDFLNRAYALHSQSNPLHPDLWPSATKFEAEIVAMTAHMLGAEAARGPDDEVCGTLSSGGTESILLAMKTYRDWARATRAITAPEVIAPVTAHAAFDKAARYFGLQLIRTPVDESSRADIQAVADAITPNTICLVGSAPPFPHGIVDPIEQLSGLALERGLGFHTDACLGGFILPWAERLGRAVPPFDFRLPGVTSISADTHKYGYAAKGTSVILYRNPALRRFQYYSTTDWPGGLYNSPTFAGSRPGGLVAACWAAMVSIGEQGYLEAARRILDTTDWITSRLRQMPALHVIGDPIFLIAFSSPELNVYQILAGMEARGWGLNGLHLPPSLHLCVTQRHTQPGVRERFVEDLDEVVEYVRQHPQAPSGVGPIYGMAASSELRGAVTEVLNWYMDTQFKV